MIKSGTIRSVLILTFVGIVLIALVEPIAGYARGQGNVMEHEEHAAKGTCSVSRTVFWSLI